MYVFYLGGKRLPVTPSKVTTKIKGANRTISLINEGEINQIRGRQLTEISFECLLPHITKYPFATYKNNEFLAADHFLAHFEELKKRKTPCKFTINRYTQKGKKGTVLANTSMLVTLEDYTITEEADNGLDIKVSMDLKEYKPYGKKYYKVIKTKKSTNKNNTTKYHTVIDKKLDKNNLIAAVYKFEPEKNELKVIDTVIVKKGDTLKSIAKRHLGSERYASNLYTLNKKVIEDAAKRHKRASSSNGYYLYPGTELKLGKAGGILWRIL